MYNESYEEYIRSILGYPNYNSSYSYENDYAANMSSHRNSEEDAQLEACYPEIYRVVYPMVNKACSTNTKPITSELIDELTDEIYLAVENDHEINININLTNETATMQKRTTSSHPKTENVKEKRGEDRQFRNRGLQDIIRILLIRELLGRPERFPGNRPPFPPNRPPMRPPFPGGPGGRPPIMPRENYSGINDLYE